MNKYEQEIGSGGFKEKKVFPTLNVKWDINFRLLIAKTLSSNPSQQKINEQTYKQNLKLFSVFFFSSLWRQSYKYKDGYVWCTYSTHTHTNWKKKKTFKSYNKLLPLNIKYLSIQSNEFGVSIIIITKRKTQRHKKYCGTFHTTSKKYTNYFWMFL